MKRRLKTLGRHLLGAIAGGGASAPVIQEDTALATVVALAAYAVVEKLLKDVPFFKDS